jgi:hypothetical protein
MSLCVVAFPHITLLYLYPCHYTLHIIIFHRLLSINHKCTQPCYFPMLLKRAAQKLKKIWDSSMSSMRAITPPIACGVMVPFRCYFIESIRFSLL